MLIFEKIYFGYNFKKDRSLSCPNGKFITKIKLFRVIIFLIFKKKEKQKKNFENFIGNELFN
jgi:hypothetical protein